MKKLTPEQDDLINDCHEKKLMEKEPKTIPINKDKFDEILIKIGRKKQNSKKEIKEVKSK